MSWINPKNLTNYLIVSVAIFFGIVIVDLAAYILLPTSLTRFAPSYKNNLELIPNSARGYPRGYFKPDSQRGFDINQNQTGQVHFFLDSKVEIFSNDIGCFDVHQLSDIKNAQYDYFAGDSYTWGYAKWDKKFPSIYERNTGRVSLKCGVTHTGQSHQFSKFKEIVSRIGKYPDRVIVGYSDNDPANDFAHPHTTVIKGFQVDIVGIDNNFHLVRKDIDSLNKDINAWSIEHDGGRIYYRMRSFLANYSLTSNLVKFLKDEIVSSGRVVGAPAVATVNSSGEIKNFYNIGKKIPFDESYISNPFAFNNREIIKKWAFDAKENNYKLFFILIPPKDHALDANYYAGLEKFLLLNNIGYLNMTPFFTASSLPVSDLYWKLDGHINEMGNLIIAEALTSYFKN